MYIYDTLVRATYRFRCLSNTKLVILNEEESFQSAETDFREKDYRGMYRNQFSKKISTTHYGKIVLRLGAVVLSPRLEVDRNQLLLDFPLPHLMHP